MPLELAYIVAPVILICIVLVASLLDRWSVPVILIALGAGILFGSDVLGLWVFSDFLQANQIANFALMFILFYGGFSTQREHFRQVALPAISLATIGVVLTALATFLVLWLLAGWRFEVALLVAVIVSSTDAAATFSILRRHSLPPNLSSTIEIESAANDPMAILLTLGAIEAVSHGQFSTLALVGEFAWKFFGGIGFGIALGHGAVWLFNRLGPEDRGHYYVLSLSVVPLIFGLTNLAEASGMLAAFIAGYVMGNRPFVHRQGVANFFSAMATICDMSMFVLLGLLVSPSQWSGSWLQGVVLFAVLAFIARPFAVWIGTLGMRLGRRARLMIAWAGLRGSVPIVLSTYPMAAGLEFGNEIFNIVFFAVILSVLIQGSTLGNFSSWLGLTTPGRPKPLYNLELMTMSRSDMDLVVVDLPGPQGVQGPRIQDLNLPPGSVITLISRGREVVAPRGDTHLEGWDQVTVLAHVADHEQVRQALVQPFELAMRPPADGEDRDGSPPPAAEA
ncbi:MAG TPA: potassium/proton antiporter [Candidatus Sumerlaeota bacterium]|nr:potassium/proton antiporter [Candidatus Sumerlaeota bacterium]